jgi:hypothetical protein
MPSRYSRYGINTAADEQAFRAARHMALAAGATPQQFEQLAEAYADGITRGLTGTALKDHIAEAPAVTRSFSSELLSRLGTNVFDPIAQHGAAPFLPAVPTAEEDAATIAKAEALMRENAKAYFRDGELQDAYADALERRGPAARNAPPMARPPVPTRESDQAVIEEAEDRLAKNPQAYFRDKDLVDRYSAALERRQAAASPDASATARPADDFSTERDRAQRDITRFEKMLRDPEASREYWANASLRAEYGAAIERVQSIESAAAAAAAAPPPPTTLAGGADPFAGAP